MECNLLKFVNKLEAFTLAIQVAHRGHDTWSSGTCVIQPGQIFSECHSDNQVLKFGSCDVTVHHSWSVLDKALEQNLGGTVVDTLGQKNEYLALVALALDCLPGEHWKLGAFTN